MNERVARVILFASIEGGNAFWAKEISEFGAVGVLDRLHSRGYLAVNYEKLVERISKISAPSLLESIEKSGSTFITPSDSSWPLALNDLEAPPIGLIVKGLITVLESPSLAIVGTRNPTHYGARVAGEFAAGFVDRQWAITSGGAYGIDAAAHRGALAAEGATIAVLACGTSVNYPAAHERLFAEIAETGLLISEVMPGAHAIPARFLNRNRIIAALASATLVVEAAFRSGSLRTARDAAQLFRPVMAVPGPITSPTSDGCHRLIAERVAELITSVADATEFIGGFK